jgi:hypothetical protein
MKLSSIHEKNQSISNYSIEEKSDLILMNSH